MTEKTDVIHEIVSTRTVHASREIVFTAWTNPDHLKNWWGPAGFTNTFHEFDLRTGGMWRFTMHGPDKGNYENACEFTEILKPALLSWKRHSQHLFSVVAFFEDADPGHTKITFRMIFATAKECEKLRPFVVDKNEENFDRLERELECMSN